MSFCLDSSLEYFVVDLLLVIAVRLTRLRTSHIEAPSCLMSRQTWRWQQLNEHQKRSRELKLREQLQRQLTRMGSRRRSGNAPGTTGRMTTPEGPGTRSCGLRLEAVENTPGTMLFLS